MRRLVFVILVSSLLVTLVFVQKGNIPTVKASSSIHQGDLILTGDNVTRIEDRRFDINGSIIVEENATLMLKNAVVNFTQVEMYQFNMTFCNSLNGSPRLLMENATITSNHRFIVYLRQNSSATISNSIIAAQASETSQLPRYLRLHDYAMATVSNSTINFLNVLDSAVVSVFNSTISYVLSVQHSPVVSVSNSTIEKLSIWSRSVNCSVSNIGPGLFGFWDFHLNSSVEYTLDSWAPHVSIRNTTIYKWQFEFQLPSNATITNSTLDTLHCDRANVWLVNTSVRYVSVSNEGRVYVLWYLDVHVVDSIDQDVPSANVTATYPNATVAESRLTDAQGWARLTLMEKMMNSTGYLIIIENKVWKFSGEFDINVVGNYTVEATYDIHSHETSTNMTAIKQIILTLEDFVIPEFPLYLILPIFIIATILVVIVYRRKDSM